MLLTHRVERVKRTAETDFALRKKALEKYRPNSAAVIPGALRCLHMP